MYMYIYYRFTMGHFSFNDETRGTNGRRSRLRRCWPVLQWCILPDTECRPAQLLDQSRTSPVDMLSTEDLLPGRSQHCTVLESFNTIQFQFNKFQYKNYVHVHVHRIHICLHSLTNTLVCARAAVTKRRLAIRTSFTVLPSTSLAVASDSTQGALVVDDRLTRITIDCKAREL